jgi:hypothetical protein
MPPDHGKSWLAVIPGADKWQRLAGWFLVVSYLVGSPAFALLELQTAAISQRFDYSPAFLYAVGGAQFICAALLFVRKLVPWSCAVLTVLSMGAVVSHFRIGSPVTSLPALAYTIIQIWYGIRVYVEQRSRAA